MNVMDWLKGVRRLDGDLLAEMGVRATTHDRLGEVAAFPYRKDGRNYAAKFRTQDKRFLSTAGVSRGLYNEDALSRDRELPIVITEGEIDCLSVMQSGFLRAVSLPDGWTEGGTKAEALVAVSEALSASPYVVVAGDNDRVGESLPKAVANILAGHDVRYVTWPEGCKDANDVLMMHGEGVVAQCINAAKRVDPPGGTISGFSDLPPMSAQRVLKVGRHPFDEVIAMEVGEISVWTGLPGNGKSTLATWIADEVSLHEGIRVGNIGFETHPYRVRDQLARSHAHKPWRDLSEPQKQELIADLDARWRLVHADPNVDNHLGWLETMVRTLVVRDRCKLVLVDPWNELEHLPEPGEKMTDYIGFALKTIRRWAKALECHVMIVAHPAKMKTDGAKPRPPTGYDIADSAAFFNKPGLGITIHPDDEENKVRIINWKTRDVLAYGVSKGTAVVEYAPAWGCYRAIGQVDHQSRMGF